VARVRRIAVRDPGKERPVDVDPALLTGDAREVIDDENIEIVCELIGGATEARELVLRAIERLKHVVTANKALLATAGDEVFSAAERRGVDVYYEASVCGGVPIVRALREGLASDRIEELHGIVNGTSNYILTEMSSRDASFADVLAEAQELGYAEADPTLDVSGGDAAHKLAILTMLCFGTHIDVADMLVEGIDRLRPIDFEMARRFGYTIKPLVIGRDHGGDIEARVHPAMIPDRWLLSDVPGAKNALYVRSYALGPSLYYGAGAGMMPTAMAVVSDVIEVCRNIKAGATGALPVRSFERIQARPLRSRDEIRSQYYMRFAVLDRAGVLGQVTTILGEHQISIRHVLQEGPRERDRPVVVVVFTHEAREGNVRLALDQVAYLSTVVEPASVIRIAG
jgi:homoserine dehydrogenase